MSFVNSDAHVPLSRVAEPFLVRRGALENLMKKALSAIVVASGLVGAALLPAHATPLTSVSPGAVTAQSSSDGLVTDVRMTKKQMMMRKRMMMKKRMMNKNM